MYLKKVHNFKKKYNKMHITKCISSRSLSKITYLTTKGCCTSNIHHHQNPKPQSLNPKTQIPNPYPLTYHVWGTTEPTDGESSLHLPQISTIIRPFVVQNAVELHQDNYARPALQRHHPQKLVVGYWQLPSTSLFIYVYQYTGGPWSLVQCSFKSALNSTELPVQCGFSEFLSVKQMKIEKKNTKTTKNMAKIS